MGAKMELIPHPPNGIYIMSSQQDATTTTSPGGESTYRDAWNTINQSAHICKFTWKYSGVAISVALFCTLPFITFNYAYDTCKQIEETYQIFKSCKGFSHLDLKKKLTTWDAEMVFFFL